MKNNTTEEAKLDIKTPVHFNKFPRFNLNKPVSPAINISPPTDHHHDLSYPSADNGLSYSGAPRLVCKYTSPVLDTTVPDTTAVNDVQDMESTSSKHNLLEYGASTTQIL